MNLPNSDGYFYLYRNGWPARSRVEVIVGSKGIVVRLKDSGPFIPIENFPFDCEWILTNPGPLGIVENDNFVLSFEATLEKTIRQKRWEQELDGPLFHEFNALSEKVDRATTATRKIFGLLKMLHFIVIEITSRQYGLK
jgi:hypothetical protein